MRSKSILLILIAASLISTACALGSSANGPASNAIVIEVAANTSLSPWLTEASEAFNAEKVKTAGGRPIFVQLTSAEEGQTIDNIRKGEQPPSLWIPDGDVWPNVMAKQDYESFQNDCQSVAQSPLVIAMWRPIAESLGWPGRSLGWLDIGSLAADPSAWAYYSGGQFGPLLRLGHTHPGLSGSGINTLLAIVQSAESKTEAVTVEDIQRPIVNASVNTFESTVSWFSTSTEDLGITMRERGIDYLGAAVVYESTVIEYGNGDPAIVPIYPFEGTFVATHPACINQAAGEEIQEAATQFRSYLLETGAQDMARQHGLRSATGELPLLDASQSQTFKPAEILPASVFNSPSVDTVYAIQDLWQSARKDVNMVLVLDVSGSMRGDKIDGMRAAAIQFVEQMGDDDYLSIITFATSADVLVQHQNVGENRTDLIREIRAIYAEGETALYDAIGSGANILAGTQASDTNNAMVVLTDGLDNNSRNYNFDQNLIDLATQNDTTVFTIAYGNNADRNSLTDLAQQANGNFYLGDQANIASIYEELSAVFGGSAGIGR